MDVQRCDSCDSRDDRPQLIEYDWYAALPRVVRLSVREREVLLLLAAGLANRPIARRLGLSERTVKSHVAQIMFKLGVDSRLQAGLVGFADQLSKRPPVPGPAAVGHG